MVASSNVQLMNAQGTYLYKTTYFGKKPKQLNT